MSPPRVCLLGLDAADASLVERWADDGTLPTLARLRQEATWVALEEDGALPSGAVWPTMVTGTHPGHHGIFQRLGVVPGTWRVRTLDPDACAVAPLWLRLDAAGARSVVVDVPFAPATGGQRSAQVVDWGTYERLRPPGALPRAAAALARRLGPYPIGWDASTRVPLTARARRRLHALLLRGVATKGAALRWLARHEPWDFLVAVFGETHAVGHWFWETAPSTGAGQPGPGPAVRDVYRAVDVELGRLLDELDPTTAVVVLAGHGMGPNRDGRHLLAPVLDRLGVLVRTHGGSRVVHALRAACPAMVRHAVSRYLPRRARAALTSAWLSSGVDRPRTRAFVVPSHQQGFVRLNLVGREPAGAVRPGSEAEALCEAVAEALTRLVDRDTGRPVVRRVFHAARTFPGPQGHRLPDLLVAWADDAAFRAVVSPELGEVAATPTDPRPGNHRPDGFAIVRGWFGLAPSPPMEGRSWANAAVR